VTIKKENTHEFEASLNIPYEKIGAVTAGETILNGESWGNIQSWRDKYDNAIGNYFQNYLPE